MKTTEARTADVAALTRAMLVVCPLARALPAPVRVAPRNDQGALLPLLNRIASRIAAPELVVAPRVELEPLEKIISDHLFGGIEAGDVDGADAAIDAALDSSFERTFRRKLLRSFDGVPLYAYASRDSDGREAVAIAMACGMPARLCDGWMRFLDKELFVVTWETRGLFAAAPGFDSAAYDVAGQANDLIAVMNAYRLKRAHVIGMCGGAVIALQAAAAHPERIASLSLWHGDFHGTPAPRTDHQRHLAVLLSIAAESRESAAAVSTALSQSLAGAVPVAIAPLVLYPYATPEVLYRYARLNGSIMGTDSEPLARRIATRALVVTSEDDSTAHPAGSHHIAAALPNAGLYVARHGDHVGLFDAAPDLMRLAGRFLTTTDLKEQA